MNPTTAVRLQGYRIAFPGYLPWNPGSAIPFGGPQKQLAFYQDFNWVKGKHDLRFGGYYMHMNDDRTFGAYANSVQSLNTTSAALPSLDNLVLGQIRRFNGAINPNGFPGGTYTTPVGFPSFTSYNTYDEFALYANDTWSIGDRLKLNLGLRYEYFGPQKKTEPKYDSNFYYSDDGCSVNTSSPTQLIDCIRGGSVLTSNESPSGNLWANDWNNFAPRVGFAWDVTGDGKTVAARRLRHRLRAQLRQRDLQRALQPAGVPGGRDRRADRHAHPADLHRQPGAVRRRRRRHQADPGRQPAPRGPEHRDRVQPLLQPVAAAGDRLEHRGQHRVHRVHRAQALRPGRPEQARRGARVPGRRDRQPAPDHPVRRLQHARQPRPVAVPRRDLRPRVAQAREQRRAVHREVHALAARRTTSARRSRTRPRTTTWGTSTPSTRCSTTATPSSTSATA